MRSPPWTEEEDSQLRAGHNDLDHTDLAKKIGRSRASLAKRIRVLGLSNLHRIRNREVPIQLICAASMSPEAAYVLGFLWADGYVPEGSNYISLCLQREDAKELLFVFHKTASSWYLNEQSSMRCGKESLQARISISNKPLHDLLITLGYRSKSGSEPTQVLNFVPEALRCYWWRGYFDGDGCFSLIEDKQSKRAKRVLMSFTSSLTQRWDFVVKLLTQLQVDFKMTKQESDQGNNSSIRIQSGPSVLRLARYLYQGRVFGLSRKYQKYLAFVAYQQEIRWSKTSRFRGVQWDKNRKRWKMQICKNKILTVCWFQEEEKAARTYDRLAKQLFGHKAFQNFNS